MILKLSHTTNERKIKIQREGGCRARNLFAKRFDFTINSKVSKSKSWLSLSERDSWPYIGKGQRSKLN